MVISPSRTQTITLHTNRRIMQPTLGIQTEDLDKRGSETKEGCGLCIGSGVDDVVASENTGRHEKEQREAHQTKDTSDGMKTRCSNTVTKGGSETLKA